MSATSVFACGPGGGATTVVACDHAGCMASTSYTDRAGYLQAGRSGWRRTTPAGPQAQHVCPVHNAPAGARS